jgi:CRISPR/Cas system CSM-associated protein Csm3 (group 7 of RAMP superfamily)
VARNILSRIHLSGTLVAQSPLHVGGHGEDVDTDMPLTRNGAGQLYVPGTSLAGALRELAERLFSENVIDELWGFQKEDQGHASFVVVEDAVIENNDSLCIEIRDHVGIDREFGAAAEHIKYDRAILPRGSKLPLHLTLEVLKEEKRNQALAMLAALKQALEEGEVRLGAAKTRGLGYVRLEKGQLTEQRFNARAGILAVLRQTQGGAISEDEIKHAKQAHPSRKRPRLKIKIHWKPVGPLMVKAGFEGIAADMVPLLSQSEQGLALVLPGSSVKGAFRSQAEKIIRTIRQDLQPQWLNQEGKKKFLDAVRLELVDQLFGAAKQHKSQESSNAPTKEQRSPKSSNDSANDLGLSALSIIDCYGNQKIKPESWQAIQSAFNDKELRQALKNAGFAAWSQAYHVAIDRWLGSAAESMLYTVLEPHSTQWETLTLELNWQRLPEKIQLPCLALLLQVIRDLAHDRLPLGFATHRGMGKVQVTGFEIYPHDLEGELASLGNIRLENGRFQNLSDSLKSAWQNWSQQGVSR